MVLALPILFLIIIAIVEFGIMLIASQGIASAAARGTREAALPGATLATVTAAVEDALEGFSWEGNQEVVVYVNGTLDTGSELANADTGDEISVTVTVVASEAAPDTLSFVNISIANTALTTSYVTRRE